METNEASPAKETNPLDFVKLELENQKMTKLLAPSGLVGPVQSKAKQIRPLGTVLISNPSRVTWGGLGDL